MQIRLSVGLSLSFFFLSLSLPSLSFSLSFSMIDSISWSVGPESLEMQEQVWIDYFDGECTCSVRRPFSWRQRRDKSILLAIAGSLLFKIRRPPNTGFRRRKEFL